MSTWPPVSNPEVEAVLIRYPAPLRDALLDLRALILETAADLPEIGELRETLKWGQPAYLPKRPRIGTTLRVDGLQGEPTGYALFFHCQSSLGQEFRRHYGDALTILGDRSIILDIQEEPPLEPLRHCIALALTYHLRKR